MSIGNVSPAATANANQVREEWLRRIGALVDSVEAWAKEMGWATRRIETPIEDSEIGNHRVPALLLQENTTRIMLQPIGRSAPGSDGIADLYWMPAYDDIARLFSVNGLWQYFHNHPGQPNGSPRDTSDALPFTKESFQEILSEMLRHASEIA
jgi:hypothetical protein